MLRKITFLFSLILAVSVKAQSQKSITGKITDANAKAISGATIQVLNSNFSTATNSSGEFSLQNIPSTDLVLRITATGYATKTRAVSASESTSGILINLSPSTYQLDEVTVTAQKREESLRQLPSAVSVLSSRQVEEYRLRNTKDITAIVPNLNSGNPGDNRNVTSLRGIATTSYDPAIATYIDGVNQFGLDTYIAQLLDVERIEVLRGPQGTLYGRNAMGGVLNIITKQPTNTTSGFAQAEIASYGQQRYSLGVRTPLVKDKLFFGATGMFNQQSGFYTNAFNNSNFDRLNNTMGNYYLKYLPNSNWGVTLNVKHNENRNNGTFPLAASLEDARANPFQLNQDATTRMIDNLFNSSLSINHFGRSINFTSQSSYQSNYRYYTKPIDGDFSPIDAITVVNNYGNKWNKVQVASQELRLTSVTHTSSPISWILGSYGFYQYNPVRQGIHFGKDAELVGAPFPNFTSISTNTLHSSGIATFGQLTYALNPKLNLTAGLRYDYERKNQKVKGEFAMDGEASQVVRPDTSATANFSAFSPKLALAFRATENNNIYGTFSRGYRAGGLTQLSSDPGQPPLYSYDPEFSNSFEIGSKNSFLKNKVSLNIALFYTQVTDAQVPTLVLPDAITVTRNAGKLESKGAELELIAMPFKGTKLDYNLGYTDATYTDLVLASNGEAVSLNGNRQIFTPKVTSSLALQQQFQLAGRSDKYLFTRGEWRYLGDQYFDLANNIKQSEYHLFNLRAGISLPAIDLNVFVENLSNKRYIDYAYEFGAVHLANPRVFGTSITYKFRK